MELTFQESACYGCSMRKGLKVPASIPDMPVSIAFIKGNPASDDPPRAFSGEHGKVLRSILSETDIDPLSIMYTYALSCTGSSSKVKDLTACNLRLSADLKRGNPKLIVTLGKTAIEALDRNMRVTKSRGKYIDIRGMKVIPTLDPENLLSMPDDYPHFRRDILFAVDVVMDRRQPLVDPPIQNYRFADTQDRFDKSIEFIRSKSPDFIAVDIETTGLDSYNDSILSISISIKRESAIIIDWIGLIDGNQENFDALNQLLQDMNCVYHNGMFDHLFLLCKGMSPNYTNDTMFESYALCELQGGHSLKRLSSDRYQAPDYDKELEIFIKTRRIFVPTTSVPPFTLSDWKDPISKQKIAIYNGSDSDYTYRLHQDLSQELMTDGVDEVPEKILIPAAKHFIQLKMDGMKVDRGYLEELGRKWSNEIKDLEERMRDFPGARYVNLGSPKQVSEFLFDKLGLRMMEGALDKVIDQDSVLEEISLIEDAEAQDYFHTASSAVFSNMKPRSTSMFMLYWLSGQSEFPKLLVQHRLVSKKYNTYYEGIVKLLDDQDRIRPDYRLHGTRTGRLSSTTPNIHGTPRIKEIRRCYIADEGYTIIAPDYSQAEVRMLAHFCEDERLVRALHEQDLHFEISKELYGMTTEEMNSISPEEKKLRRRAAKTIVFGLMYGRGPKSIATQTGMSLEEAKEFIERFFLIMPKIRSWKMRQENDVTRKREVVSLYGRKRRFPFLPDKKAIAKAKRQSVNMPIQSSVSDMTLLSNMDIIRQLKDKGIPALVGFHIHDGFLFQVPDKHLDESIAITKERMSNVGFETKVPFDSDTEIGKTWGSLKSV